MLAYRHQFHAGNFADVMKHALLARLLVGLSRKDAPYCYVDTHAGLGRYDLSHPWSQKNAEHASGVAQVWQRSDAPAELSAWLDIVRAMNPNGRLEHYPGSPEIAQRLRRAADRMVLSELNPTDHAALKANMAGVRGVSVILQDGYKTLSSHLPPAERRGLVLLDSSFDRAGEFTRLVQAVHLAHERFATGVMAVWYPLMDPSAMRRFERSLHDSGVRRILLLELSVHPEDWRESLRGCGLIVINPPYGFDREARGLLAWLATALAPDAGSSRVQWLVSE